MVGCSAYVFPSFVLLLLQACWRIQKATFLMTVTSFVLCVALLSLLCHVSLVVLSSGRAGELQSTKDAEKVPVRGSRHQ